MLNNKLPFIIRGLSVASLLIAFIVYRFTLPYQNPVCYIDAYHEATASAN